MDRTINLLDYLPVFLQEIEDLVKLSEAETPEIAELWTKLSELQNEQYLEDSTEIAVKRWEKILGITTQDTDTLEQRKYRITTRLRMRLPYTYNNLKANLITLCGEKGYTLVVDPVACTIEVRITLGVKYMFDEVEKLLDKVLPCNLLLDFRLLYNRHMDLKRFTHTQLKQYIHKVIKEEVLS